MFRTSLPRLSQARHRSNQGGALAALVALVVAVGSFHAADARAEVLPGHRLTLQQNSQALGISAGYPGASGFAYRKYFGNSFVQMNLLPLVANRGSFLAVMMGANFGHYLVVWQRQNSLSLMPTTTALRAVVGASTYFSRDEDGQADVAVPGSVGSTTTKTTSSTTVQNTTGLSAGVGFEFGAVMRSGFSVSVDLMLTATWDNDGFEQLVPLPFGTVVYSW